MPATVSARARFDSAGSALFGAEGEPLRGLMWRRRGLIAAALFGCLSLFLWARWLAATPHVDVTWQAGTSGQLILQDSPLPALQPWRGSTVLAMRAPGGPVAKVDAHFLQRAPRWQVDAQARLSSLRQWREVALVLKAAAASGRVEFQLASGDWVPAPVRLRNYAGLGLAFWPLLGLALLLYLFATVMLLAQFQARNLPLAVMSLCQSANLVALASETAPGTMLSLGMLASDAAADPFGLAAGAAMWMTDMGVRMALDLCMGASAVHAFVMFPRRAARARLWVAVAWGSVLLWVLLMRVGSSAGLWWWGTATFLALNLASLAVIRRSYEREANPYARIMQRFATIGLVAFFGCSLVAALQSRLQGTPVLGMPPSLAASVAWSVVVTALLMLTPFLARSRQLLREFATLAGISTVATSLDLLFVAVFALGPFTSLAVAVFIALGIYAAMRQRLMDRLVGSSMLTTERTFDHIYRAAREVQTRPNQYTQRLTRLLREVFEPLEVLRVEQQPSQTSVAGGGSALVVPLRSMEDAMQPGEGRSVTLALRFAQHGQRLFNQDDARLADRVVDQLRRAVAYDQAVEKGRHEERQRIAQDLHDDIGARLLTLMYQSTKPEMEDYIRHTLQDLKTLTRGLAAEDHLLSHAAGEWKADITQRVNAAHANLGWSFSQDREVSLSMGHWSALTRALRELVSNALYHGRAARVDVVFSLQGSLLQLVVSDDGVGKDPAQWAHGLGLGGVRKRVKALGGTVIWRLNDPQGIVCEIEVKDFAPLDQGVEASVQGPPDVIPQ